MEGRGASEGRKEDTQMLPQLRAVVLRPPFPLLSPGLPSFSSLRLTSLRSLLCDFLCPFAVYFCLNVRLNCVISPLSSRHLVFICCPLAHLTQRRRCPPHPIFLHLLPISSMSAAGKRREAPRRWCLSLALRGAVAARVWRFFLVWSCYCYLHYVVCETHFSPLSFFPPRHTVLCSFLFCMCLASVSSSLRLSLAFPSTLLTPATHHVLFFALSLL